MDRTPLQKYLDEHGDPSKLKEDLGVNYYEHPALPLVGFKYGQIDSPKTDPVVRWSRGTILEKGTWDLVAQPFVRFFNLGEGSQEDMASFDWSDFGCWTKLDGSLVIMYYYDGMWHVNTSGSFAKGPINSDSLLSWEHVIWDVATINPSGMDEGVTYVFELCTSWNKIIRHYPDPRLVMLGAYRGPVECEPEEVERLARDAGTQLVERHNFKSRKEIEDFLSRMEETDPTFEGVVIRDRNGLRYKVKSKTYLALSHMYGNGQLGRPKRILPFVLTGETGEILSYFPELEDEIEEVKKKVDAEYENLVRTWREFYRIKDQKDFALAIKNKTKFTGILFGVRKRLGDEQSEDSLKEVWRNSADLIVKMLFK